MVKSKAYGLLAAILALFIGSGVVIADNRPFTFTYDTYPMGKGQWEYEQWVTYRGHTGEDSGFQRWDFRHEFEFGITDNFDLSFYVASWRWEDTEEHTGTQFNSSSVEAIYYLMNPVTDSLGLALYGEVGVGQQEMEFEVKVLLQKDWGNWTAAYNFVVEHEVEGIFDEDEDETEGVIGNTFGLAYSPAPSWSVGGELVIESIYPDWSEYEDTVIYAGPVISYTGGTNWWVTITPMIQLSDVDEQADYHVRMIAGITF